MMETTVILKPESEWRKKERWYSSWAPEWLARSLRHVWRDRISHDDLVDEMDAALKIPGTTNAWTMPIKNRIDMLSTGIRTPIGIKVFGADLKEIERIGTEIEAAVKTVPATRSVFAERVAGGYFIDFDLNREALARYGLTVDDANAVIMTAIGGETVTTVINGRERYSVNVRYPRELREDLDRLSRVLVPTMSGAQVPLAQLATIHQVQGPAMIRNENGLLSGYVYVDFDTSKEDVGGYVEKAKEAVAAACKLPTGYALVWSGQYENMIRVKERLKVVIPVTLVLIWLLMYANTKSAMKTMIVLLAVPFSIIGAVWFLWLLGYNLSIAVWVGVIALMGLDAETGIFMLLFLDLAHEEAKVKGLLRDRADLIESIIHGAVKRVRPKAMTVFAAFFGLIPIMWSTGAGADLMKRIAAPMVGGLVTSFALELLVYPAIYMLWKQRELPRTGGALARSLGSHDLNRKGHSAAMNLPTLPSSPPPGTVKDLVCGMDVDPKRRSTRSFTRARTTSSAARAASRNSAGSPGSICCGPGRRPRADGAGVPLQRPWAPGSSTRARCTPRSSGRAPARARSAGWRSNRGRSPSKTRRIPSSPT